MEVRMTINNLPFALELWDNGFNIITIKIDPITPTPNNPADDFQIIKIPFGKWQKCQINIASIEEVKKLFEFQVQISYLFIKFNRNKIKMFHLLK